ncbi:MAG TPA: hypothetical protein VFP90_16700 [Gemmatimonadaceae bacterium]|jgi:hypothetical protein|nr:hypothetical protein [Gemmatimonadaceae bacterium]
MSMMHYEGRHDRPISRALFLRRMMRHGGYAAVLVAFSLVLGVAGYMGFAHLSLVDAILNSAMLLGGMGPVGAIEGTGAKLFAAGFALYSGLVFLLVASILLAPVFHRVLHIFHWKTEGGNG